MSKSRSADPIASCLGQVLALKAFAAALVRTHPDAKSLLTEFQQANETGLYWIRSTRMPSGTIAAYKQSCDELVVTLSRRMNETRRERTLIL